MQDNGIVPMPTAQVLCHGLNFWYRANQVLLFVISTSEKSKMPFFCSTKNNMTERQEAEKHLSEMVVSKALVAKIDQPMGIVCFQAAKNSNDILNLWAMNLEKLLDLVEKSCHQIHKETMVHKAALKV
ncbi:hypothetical protein ACSBR1_016383 [Camellia fascicularis]